MLSQLPKGALVLGDRLYSLMDFFRELNNRGLWGLFRRNKLVKFKKIRLLSRKQGSRTLLEDWLALAGSGQTGSKVMVRLIIYRRKGFSRDMVTTVLDPGKLTAEQALLLYPYRWSIERLFFDLKEILNLHRFYAANPNAVAMQIYAAAIVHTACRICQAQIAREHGIVPEEISPAKLYPMLAAASSMVTMLALYHQHLESLHGHLNRPSLGKFRFAKTTLASIRVEKRNCHRRKKRFHAARKKWKSLTHIHGFKNLS